MLSLEKWRDDDCSRIHSEQDGVYGALTFVDASKAEAVANAIMDAAHSDLPGAGIVAVMPVEQFFHIRTRSENLPDES